ncbi:FtsK/SpoIIIE domain-containing protein [Bacillus thuringiensis]|uniref:FtsK/SpoIIIE domain-containing protein n=1 Tax=Bacillus thuringiensis TaxID=1428 RepID=UPI00159C85BF|nr:FtsK/SpoIIIE domain-containing protein [Bacillus thuringiensis]
MLFTIGAALASGAAIAYAMYDLHFEYGLPYKINLEVNPRDDWQVPIGVNEQREQILLDFAKTPHVSLGGGTRYGKSNLLNSIIVSLLTSKPRDVKFTLVDLKGGIELGGYETVKQVTGVAYEPDEALQMLSRVYDMMKATQEELRRSKRRKVTDKKHFVIIDEAGELNPNEAIDKEEKLMKIACQKYMSQIARLGAGLGFHLILATQYPTGDVLPRQCKQNSDAVISFRVRSAVASKVILDEKGAEELPDIKGRAIFIQGANTHLVQTYRVNEQQIRHTIKNNKRKVRHHVQLPEVKTTEPTPREDTFIIEETRFSD